jgi:YD repeat-containing protein
MPEVPAIYTGPRAIQPAVSGTTASVYVGTGPGYRRDVFDGRPARSTTSQKHLHTQTYDDSGRLVESADPPIVNIRT